MKTETNDLVQDENEVKFEVVQVEEDDVEASVDFSVLPAFLDDPEKSPTVADKLYSEEAGQLQDGSTPFFDATEYENPASKELSSGTGSCDDLYSVGDSPKESIVATTLANIDHMSNIAESQDRDQTRPEGDESVDFPKPDEPSLEPHHPSAIL